MAKKEDKGVNPVVAGVVGAAAGAAGAVATMVLTSKKTRQQVGETISDIKDQVVARVKEYTENPNKLRYQVKHAVKKFSSPARSEKR